MSQPRTLILGFGSAFGDDQAGIIVAQRLRVTSPELEVRCACSPSYLLDWVEGFEQLHIIDACRGAGELGTIIRHAWPAAAITEMEFIGTHDLSLDAALRLAEECEQLPPRVVVWGIEAEPAHCTAAFMAPLSPKVAAAAESLIDRLIQELSHPEAAPHA